MYTQSTGVIVITTDTCIHKALVSLSLPLIHVCTQSTATGVIVMHSATNLQMLSSVSLSNYSFTLIISPPYTVMCSITKLHVLPLVSMSHNQLKGVTTIPSSFVSIMCRLLTYSCHCHYQSTGVTVMHSATNTQALALPFIKVCSCHHHK